MISPVDLNHFPVLSQPSSVTQTKKFGCLCFKSNPVNISFTVRQGGFVPGQTIICDAIVDNQSSKTLDILQVSLVENCTLNASSKSRVDTRIIHRFDLRQVQPKTTEEFRCIEIIVPPVCPTTMSSSSRVLLVGYHVQLVVGATGFSVNSYSKIPITVGTVPFQTEKPPLLKRISYEPSFLKVSKSIQYRYPYFIDLANEQN